MDAFIQARFWSKVDRSGDCWLWTASCNKGYGQFRCRGRLYLAHRFAYELTHGPLLPDQEARHRCHNRSCVNPSHLIPGTHQENIQDRVDRRGGKLGDVAGYLGVSEKTVSRLKKSGQLAERLRFRIPDLPVTDERLLSKSEAAYRLGVSEKTVDRLVASGKLATRKVGKRSKFEPGEIERYLQPAQTEQPPEG